MSHCSDPEVPARPRDDVGPPAGAGPAMRTGLAQAPGLDRRALLRGALSVGIGAAVSAALAACDPPSSPGSAAGPPGAPSGATSTPAAPTTTAAGRLIPAGLKAIPTDFALPAEQQGTLVVLNYDTYESMNYNQRARRLSKRAIVYLPYGYQETTPHNVFYLMHGGWGDETATVGTPGNPSALKHTLDNAIAAGEITPLIVVCPTYNNASPQDSANFGLALDLTQNYHRELLNDLVPAVEGRFRCYADNVSPDGLKASRDHRGFGGFSMGAVATWRIFQYGLDYFRYFLPMSCGTSLDMGNVLAAAARHDPSDYFVWVITGSDDFAHPYDQDRVAFMRRSRSFSEADNEQDGNFTFRVKDGYSHDRVAAMEYTYNGLRWFWSP